MHAGDNSRIMRPDAPNQRGVAAYLRGRVPRTFVLTLMTLLAGYMALGRQAGEPQADPEATLRAAPAGENAEAAMEAHNYLGNMADGRKEDRLALRHWYAALAISQRLSLKQYQLNLLEKIAATHYDLFDLSELEKTTDEALQIGRELKANDHIVAQLLRKGLNALRFGDYGEAERYYKDALAAAGGIELRYNALKKLGQLYYMQSQPRYEESEAIYQEALAISRTLKKDEDTQWDLGAIGYTYLKRWLYEEALSYLEQARELAHRVGHEAKRFESRWVGHIADVYFEQGRYAEAEKHYQTALDLKDQTFNPSYGIFAFKGIGTIRTMRGDYQGALQCYENAIELIEKYQKKIPNESLSIILFEYDSEVYEQAVSLLLKMADLYGKPEYAHQAFAYADQSKARLLVKAVLKKQAVKEEEAPVTVARVQQALPGPQRVLIEYLVGQENVIAFIIGKDFFAREVMPVTKKDIEERLRSVSVLFDPSSSPENAQARRDPQKSPFNGDRLHELYQAIFRPVEKYLKPGQELVIIRDDILNYFPFEVLITDPNADPPAYLLYKYPISYEYSAAILNYAQDRSRRPSEDLLAVAPDYSGSPNAVQMASAIRSPLPIRNGPLVPLPFTIWEIEAIGRGIRNKLLLRKDEATKTKFLDRCAYHRILHFAAHSWLDHANPAYSGICFTTKGPQPDDDSILYLHEIAQLNLSADLVVLSVCDSVIGKLRRGEGLQGMSRAFAYAGVPSLVATLWPVPDTKVTVVLMEKFYEYLGKGYDKPRALQRAKLDVLAQNRYANPYVWANFVLIGDPGKIEIASAAGSVARWVWWAAIAVILIGILVISYVYRNARRRRGAPA